MKIAIGSDHAGFELKKRVHALLLELGHEVVDLGTHDPSPVDYPDFAEAVGKAIIERKAQRGIVICGSGVGASVAANKIPGIRAELEKTADPHLAHDSSTNALIPRYCRLKGAKRRPDDENRSARLSISGANS